MRVNLASVIALARFELSDSDVVHAHRVLSEETDWQEWINQVELHGLSGFANKHAGQHQLPIPAEVLALLKKLKHRHTSAAQMRCEVLCDIDTQLRQKRIPYVALKGAALVSVLYGDGYLRPMRDMDLLLPKSALSEAADCLRGLGFDLPETQPSKFMRDMHQLPNATKSVNGMISSVELHLDGISREVPGHFYYPTTPDSFQKLSWANFEFDALENVQMLHQVSKHLEGLHSSALLKLINVMDVIGLAGVVLNEGKWQRLEIEYPHVINTLRCLHLLTPLPDNLQNQVGSLPCKPVSGVGQIMGSLTNALFKEHGFKNKFQSLLLPSDWWMHLHYNVDPNKSLWLVKFIRHPARVINWLLRRTYSGVLGG